jgi:signal transduction histidine kinase/HAMP domain-containing protein
MLYSLLRRLYRRWNIQSLSAKLLVPSIGVMLLSLLGSTLAFVGGTALTRTHLLNQQTAAETERVIQALRQRVDNVDTAATLLANDPQVIDAVQQETEAALSALNSRAVVVRDRFGLSVIQIYDDRGVARTNLMLPSLYRESSMIDLAEAGSPVVRAVDGHLLLLRRAAMPEGAGTIVVGTDLETELRQILTQYQLTADLGLSMRGAHVETREGLPFDAPGRWGDGHYRRTLSVNLGATPTELLLVRPTTDVKRVTNTGLLVMVGSTLLTTLLLSSLNVVIIRSIARPIHHLAVAAEDVAQGDLKAVELPATVDAKDEVGLLVRAFNRMVADLRDLYANLEAKVKARTRELATTAAVAEAVSSSLELEVILKRSMEKIQQRLGACHVGVFLIEPGSDVAVLQQAVGEAGQELTQRGLRIPLGSKSPVGIAAATGESKIVQNVRTASTHLKPPLLMDTASAAAIPLLVGGATIGAIDVQCRQPEAFDPDTVKLLNTLADQLATGVHNARLYDQQRRTAEHLAEVDRLKTQFLAVMSHELRTPLNTIIGFSKVMLNGLDGPLTDKQEQDLSFIYESGQHLLALIEDILDISQINAGKMRLDVEDVQLPDIVQGAVEAVKPMIEEKPVELQVAIPSDLPLIRADKRRVRQVLLNLLSNAAKFTEAGRILVRARVVEALNANTERVEPGVEISVSDTGVGIPEDELVHIFKEFTQVDSSSSRDFEGAGLGLPITKKLVELHGGRIWAESEVDRGSTFTFVLPVNRPGAEGVEEALVAEEIDLEMFGNDDQINAPIVA